MRNFSVSDIVIALGADYPGVGGLARRWAARHGVSLVAGRFSFTADEREAFLAYAEAEAESGDADTQGESEGDPDDEIDSDGLDPEPDDEDLDGEDGDDPDEEDDEDVLPRWGPGGIRASRPSGSLVPPYDRESQCLLFEHSNASARAWTPTGRASMAAATVPAVDFDAEEATARRPSIVFRHSAAEVAVGGRPEL